MRRMLTLLTVVSVSVIANASALSFWLSTSATDPQVQGQVPNNCVPGQMLYLFADVDGEVWNGISAEFTGADSIIFYNPPASELPNGITRWDTASDLTGPDIQAVAVTAGGLGAWFSNATVVDPDPYCINGKYLVGEMTFTNEIYVTNTVAAKKEGVPGEDWVIWGDNTPTPNNQTIITSNPIATPEPATMALLATAGLLIRRR